MIGSLKQIVKKAALNRGVVVKMMASSEAQARFFAAVKPVETEHALIRLGGDGDGGYLVPDDLAGIDACFSPGVDLVANFEAALIERGMQTFQIDGSVAQSPLDHERNQFERKDLGIVTRDNVITLDDWVNDKAPGTSELILQMDIEGAEWLALAQVSEAVLKRFRVIVLELHFLDYAFDNLGSMVIAPVLERLSVYFDIVHLHANNMIEALGPTGAELAPIMEMTLLRKDRSSVRKPVSSLPHPLDQDNVPDRPSVVVPKSMYAN